MVQIRIEQALEEEGQEDKMVSTVSLGVQAFFFFGPYSSEILAIPFPSPCPYRFLVQVPWNLGLFLLYWPLGLGFHKWSYVGGTELKDGEKVTNMSVPSKGSDLGIEGWGVGV